MSEFLPYGRQSIDQEDIDAVVEVLQSDWLTTGPKVGEFEQALANIVNVQHAVAVSSGTAALHCAMQAIGIKAGDEVIVPAITFLATANCVVFCGATPVFADVDADTLLIDPLDIETKITPRTRAIIAVDYAGQPCDYEVLRTIADKHGLILVADACHSLGASFKGRNVGGLADISVFSFHPVKHITTAEGGALVTNNGDYAGSARQFRNHGMSLDHHQRQAQATWQYSMTQLGYNYRMSDLHAALGCSQLKKLAYFIQRRQAIANCYDAAFAEVQGIVPLSTRRDVEHAYHLYVIKLDGIDREEFFNTLRQRQIGVNVHYYPVHLQPFYRERFATREGDCPVAENAKIVSLPIFPAMSDDDVERVVSSVNELALAMR